MVDTTNPASGAPQESSEQALAELNEALEDEKKNEEEPKIPRQPLEERLNKIESSIRAAIQNGDETLAHKQVQLGKQTLKEEKEYREKELQDAQDYFDEALKEYGEKGKETLRAANEVENWRNSLRGFDEYITRMDEYYDKLLTAETSRKELPDSPRKLQEMIRSLRAEFDAEVAKLTASMQGNDSEKAREIDALKASAYGS